MFLYRPEAICPPMKRLSSGVRDTWCEMRSAIGPNAMGPGLMSKCDAQAAVHLAALKNRSAICAPAVRTHSPLFKGGAGRLVGERHCSIHIRFCSHKRTFVGPSNVRIAHRNLESWAVVSSVSRPSSPFALLDAAPQTGRSFRKRLRLLETPSRTPQEREDRRFNARRLCARLRLMRAGLGSSSSMRL